MIEALLNNVGGPMWLVAKVDQRIAHVEAEAGEGIDAFAKEGGVNPLVMMTLTEPQDQDLSIDDWERSCDNCGVVTPKGTAFYTGQTARKLKHGQIVILTFGMCGACKDLE
ncbi:MAG: hypothetical protein HOV97_05680 [Nonomuraea sp.]|nr:hypothetical protein [Nonomuraea sp.]